MFGYEYVDLSPEQVEARRKLLDQAGFQAYLFPILLVAAIWIYRTLLGPDGNTWSSGKAPSAAERLSRRLDWILNTTYIGEFGPLQVQLLGLFYGAFLLFRIAYQTGNDYMHVTKAFGHVAVSQLPMHYLLAIKYPNSPLTLTTGLTHERLNAYHRLFGRLIHALLATHAILYMRFFIAKGLLEKRIKDRDVRLGVIAFWSLNFLAILALPPIRAKVYHKVFYRSHVILSALLLAVLFFHVPYTRIYVAQAAVFWLGNGFLRNGSAQKVSVKCESVGKDLIRVKAKTTEAHLYPYLPGVHIYLNKNGLGPRTPFTVLSAKGLEKQQSDIELIAKNSGGPMTSWLATVAKDGKEANLQLEGPYGEAQQYMPDFLDEKVAKKGKFFLVAGGVGATYTLPIYKILVKTRGNAEGIKMLWIVRKEEEARWAKDFLVDNVVASGIHVAVTQPENPRNLELGTKVKHDKTSVGRPDFDKFVDDILKEKSSKNPYEPLTIMVCGPAGLSKSLRKAVGKRVFQDGIDVRWYEEQFGFGGS